MFCPFEVSSGDMPHSDRNDGASVNSDKGTNSHINNARDLKDEEEGQKTSPLIDSDGLCRPSTPDLLSPMVP